MADAILTAQQKLDKIKEQNKTRQKKFYALNAEKIRSTRRAKYKTMADAVKTLKGLPLVDPYQYTPNDDDQFQEIEIAPVVTKKGRKVKTVIPAATALVPVTYPRPFNPKEHYKTYQDIMSKLSPLTQAQYKTHIKILFKILGTTNYLKTLMIAKPNLDAINTARFGKKDEKLYKTNSKKAFVQGMLITMTQLSLPVPDDQHKKYKQAFEVLRLQSIEENNLKAKTKPVILFAKYLEKVKEHYGDLSKQYVISKLYNEITVRDDFHLKLVKTLAENTDKLEQYLVVPTAVKQPLTIIINHYKTVKKYGVIQETLSESLSQLIRDYIKANKIGYGKYLFGKSVHNSTYVSKMNKEIGMPGAISEYRHMKASEIVYQSAEERVLLAHKMKHSPFTNLNYVRQIIGDDDPNEIDEDLEMDANADDGDE